MATERAPVLPPVAKADDGQLPVHSAIRRSRPTCVKCRIEPERACSRQCTYCVMRRSTNGGCARCRRKRYSTPSRKALSELDWSALRSPTTEITDLANALADRDLSIGISSLRADRLKRPLLEALFAAATAR